MEFALVIICAVPLFFGTVAVGVSLGRAEEAVQVTRDVGHMYANGVDFTSVQAQQLVSSLGSGFDLSASGNAVLIFSQITTVFAADCTNAGVSPCTNSGQPVFVQRVTIGNTSLKASAFGTPPAQYMDSLGNIKSSDYMAQGALVANGFGSVIAQNDGDVAYLVEGFFNMPDLSFLSVGFQGTNGTPGGFYVRAIF
jgi:hypothetical protein